jgi:DNA-binding MarR family transcriptional regulator
MIRQIGDQWLLLFEKEQQRAGKLGALDVEVLSCVKANAQTEKQLSKKTGVDILVLSPIVTELMLMGYVETFRRRRLVFFSREYVSITPEGLAALEKAKSPLQKIIELIRERALETLENIAASSPALKILFVLGKATYKTAKVLI